jgi:4-hydroxy-tetrahydrodipicolinate synthase
MRTSPRPSFETIPSTELPIILHDIPARTVRELADDTLTRLALSKHFIGLLDGTGDVTRPMRLRSKLPQSFRLISGHDQTALTYLAEGGDACISMISNVTPDLCQAMFTNLRLGRPQIARYLQKLLVPLECCVSTDTPAGVKYALSLLGLMDPGTRSGDIASPSVPTSFAARACAGSN